MDDQTLAALATPGIVGASTRVGAALAAHFGYNSGQATVDQTKTKDELAFVKKDLIAACRQISACHQACDHATDPLEQADLDAWVAKAGGAGQSLKIRNREQAVARGFAKLTHTHNQATRPIDEFEPRKAARGSGSGLPAGEAIRFHDLP